MLSMTGQGQAHNVADGCRAQVELRSVNNRFLKVMVRCGDMFNAFGPRVEKLVQSGIKRGSVNVNIKIELDALDGVFKLNEAVLRNYQVQFAKLSGRDDPQDWTALLALPGVVHDSVADEGTIEQAWPVVQQAVNQAIANINQMRQAEGDAMGRDLGENLNLISTMVQQITLRAPAVGEAYEKRMLDRMRQLLEPHQVQVESADIAREVGLFADRCDISEEIVRLRSHIEQFTASLTDSESQGRKLDFLTQEMFREVNTIGSKANDAEISQCVISVKTAIERIREMVQNIE